MNSLADLSSLLAMLALGMGWMRLSRGRELAATEARRLCQRHGLQLLDDTVGLRSLRLRRHAGHWRWIRGYVFDVSIDGADREPSRLWMAGRDVHGWQLPTASSRIADHPPADAPPRTAQIIDLSERIRRTQHGRLH